MGRDIYLQDNRVEQGSIVILSALLLFSVAMFVALVIDSARLTSASRQKSQSADFLAQSFLQGYSSYWTTSRDAFTSENQTRAYIQGVLTAIRTGRLNYQTANQVTAGTQDEIRQVTDESDFFNQNVNTPGKRGFIQTGLWFYAKPKGLENLCSTDSEYSIDDQDRTNRCPCLPEDPTRPFGCFVACDNALGCRNAFDPYNTVNRLPPNAAEVTLSTESENSDGISTNVKNIFGGIGGNTETKITRSGTAVLTPRRTVLLLDLSRPTTAETHYQWQKSVNLATDQPSEYSYRCLNNQCVTVSDSKGSFGQCTGGNSAGYDQAYGVDDIDPEPSTPSFILDTSEPTLNVSGFSDKYRQSFRALDPPAPASSFFPRGTTPLPFCPQSDRQCKRQYQCAEVDTDGDGIREAEEIFLIDGGFTDEGGEAKAAQPHTNILATAHEILQTIYSRRIVGDMVGFIGFGQSVDTTLDSTSPIPRTYRKTNRYIPPTAVMMSSLRAWEDWGNATDFQKIYDFTDPRSDKRVWRAQHNIFPRPEEFSDLPLALWHAHNMLAQIPGMESADNSIVLVSSGLTSCRRSPVAEKELPAGFRPTCGRLFEAHQSSLQEMFDYRVAGTSEWRLQSNRIKLHAAIVGSKVTPHSIAIHKFGSDPAECLTEREMRSRNLYTTLPPATYEQAESTYEGIGRGALATATTYSGSAHWLSSAARQLGGFWLPIRMNLARCGTAPACADNTMEDELDAACGAQPMPQPPNPETGKYPPANSSERFPEASANYNVDGDDNPGWLNGTALSVPADAEGRIFCDPKCTERLPGTQGVERQVQDALADFYSLPPIALVDEPSS